MPAKRYGTKRAHGLKANQAIAANLPVFLASGLAVGFAAATPASLYVGTATLGADATDQPDGSVFIEVDSAETKFTNAGDITIADVGSDAFFSAANNVSADSATNTRVPAGKIIQVDEDGVWVSTGV